MPGTRSSASKEPASADTESSRAQVVTYTTGAVPEIWLADGAAEQFHIINLPDPKTSEPRRFAYYTRRSAEGNTQHGASGDHGRPSIGEIRTFQTSTPASFLVHPEDISESQATHEVDKSNAESHAQDEPRVFTTKQTLHMVTEIDMAFLLLPVLCPKPDAKADDDGPRARFLPFDDMMETWSDMKESQASRLLNVSDGNQLVANAASARTESMEAIIRKALDRVCNVVDAGDEKAYGFSLAKFQEVVLQKAVRLTESILPASLEEHAEKLIESTHVSMSSLGDENAETPAAMATPGELSVARSDTQESAVSAVFTPTTAADSQSTYFDEVDGTVRRLARVRVALGFILANYVPEHVSANIISNIDGDATCGLDFTSLHERVLSKRESDKKIDVSRLYSNKRGADDDERLEERAEKKRKLEEEEKKKKEASHGVKALAKVNTKGMAKMTSFFQTKPKTQ